MERYIGVTPEQLIELIDAALSADYARIRRLGGELAQRCLEQGDEEAAKRLQSFIRRRGVPLQTSGIQQAVPVDNSSRLPLVDEEPWPSKTLIMNANVEEIVTRFLSDVANADLLRAEGLLTRFGLMIAGPPGTGKTLLAGHIAAKLQRPFFVARLDSLISSRLGETAKNIRQIFEFVPTRGALLLLDELDAIAKMRDDRHELGELKRVVNTVIQGLDSLDDQAVIVAATNHPQLLDPAIWRRFPYRCNIELPDLSAREGLWSHFLYENNPDKTKQSAILSYLSDNFSGADIENLALAARRSAVLSSIGIQEAQLLAAVARSRPPHIQFPATAKLQGDERKELVRKLASFEGATHQEIMKMLGVSHPTFYRDLKEESHE
jgi:SpoVK/Ycf46/Vps4 family AAA+-type ATPase